MITNYFPLRDCLGDETVMITLSGVDCMNDDPSAVSVLYAKVSLKDSSARYGTQFIHRIATQETQFQCTLTSTCRGCESDQFIF